MKSFYWILLDLDCGTASLCYARSGKESTCSLQEHGALLPWALPCCLPFAWSAVVLHTTTVSPPSMSLVLPSPRPLGSTPKATSWGTIVTPQASMVFFCARAPSPPSTSPVLPSPRPSHSTPESPLLVA